MTLSGATTLVLLLTFIAMISTSAFSSTPGTIGLANRAVDCSTVLILLLLLLVHDKSKGLSCTSGGADDAGGVGGRTFFIMTGPRC
jgi:hypothetical protein